jgi:hypothetical protein
VLIISNFFGINHTGRFNNQDKPHLVNQTANRLRKWIVYAIAKKIYCKTLVVLKCYNSTGYLKFHVMKNKEKATENNDKTKGSSKGKASFDQNGKGSSPKFGQAGSTPNESGESGIGTVNKNKKA